MKAIFIPGIVALSIAAAVGVSTARAIATAAKDLDTSDVPARTSARTVELPALDRLVARLAAEARAENP
jgi:hypothetical protein